MSLISGGSSKSDGSVGVIVKHIGIKKDCTPDKVDSSFLDL